MTDPENKNRADEFLKDARLESELKKALRREDAPEGFAARVLARAAQTSTSRSPWWTFFQQPTLRWSTVATLSLALIAGGLEYRHLQRVQQEHAAGEAAKGQLLLALHIAGSKLQLAKSRVNEIHSDSNGNDQTDQQEKE